MPYSHIHEASIRHMDPEARFELAIERRGAIGFECPICSAVVHPFLPGESYFDGKVRRAQMGWEEDIKTGTVKFLCPDGCGMVKVEV